MCILCLTSGFSWIVAKWPPPENVSQLRSFLGFCNFYHRFIDNYLDKCQPLNLLLQKAKMWSWTVDQHTAFENLKAAYTSKPVLLMPDRTKLNVMHLYLLQEQSFSKKIQMEIGTLSLFIRNQWVLLNATTKFTIVNLWQLFVLFGNGNVTYIDPTLLRLCGPTITISLITCTHKSLHDDKFDGW